MYMANAEFCVLEPNATYIPLTRVGVLRWLTQILKFALGIAHIFSVFRYQHVGTGNAKLWRWGSKPTPVNNVNGFESQWNIGFKSIFHCDAKYLVSPVGVGQCPRRQNFVLGIPTCWYLGANANP